MGIKINTGTTLTRRAFLRAVVVASVLLAAQNAHAACTSPTGAAGDVVYGSNNIMAYCNGTVWVNMGTNLSIGFGTLTTGDFCTATSSTQITCTTGTINLNSQASGTLQAAQFPAMTGDVTNTAGSLTTTVGSIGGKAVSLGGSFTTSGAFPLTLTTTGATNVTLPTSGTLVSTTTNSLPNLATVGTITTGVWNGTPIGAAYGGTGDTTLTAHGVMIGEGTSPVAITAAGTAGQILTSSGASADPLWTTATYPSTTTVSQLLYSSATNTVTGLATANNGTLITGATGIPSISSTLPSAVQGNITTVGTIATGTWAGTAIGTTHGGTGATTITGAVSNLLGNPATGTYSINCTSAASCTTVAAAGGTGTVNSGTLYNMAYYAATGSAVSGDTNIVTDASSDLIVASGVLSIGTTSTTNAINLKGTAAQTIAMVRNASSSGNNLTVQAGGGQSGGTNQNGGLLNLSAGITTGTGTTGINFTTYPAGSTGATDNPAMTALSIFGSGVSGTNAVTSVQANAGSGSNQNGGTLNLAGGVSTGTGTSNINFNVYPAGSPGSTANAATTEMTVSPTGVAVGTTNTANATFTVNSANGAQALFQSTGATNANVYINSIAGTGQSSVWFQSSGTSYWQAGMQGTGNLGFFLWDQANTQNAFSVTSAGLLTLGEGSQMSLPKTGNVGIGIPNPGYPLQVVGTIATGDASTTSGTMLLKPNSNGAWFWIDNNGNGNGLRFSSGATPGTAPMFFTYNGQLAIGTTTVTTGSVLDLSSNTTTANSTMVLPVGTTGTRPTTGVPGMLRYNSTTPAIEAYIGSAWTALGAAGGSGTVSSGNQYQMAYYNATGSTVSGDANITTDSSNDLVVPSGKVSIGTTNLQDILTVGQVNGSGGVTIYNSSTASTAQYPALTLFDYTGGHGGAGLIQSYAARGTAAAPTAVQAGDTLSVINSYGQYDSTSGHWGIGSQIQSIADATFSATNFPTDITFATTPASGGGASERMRISATGKVGIGTTSPAAGLDVYTSAGVGTIDIGGMNGISFPASDNNHWSIAIGPAALAGQTASGAWSNVGIGANTMSDSGMTTAAAGNVAIGYNALALDKSGGDNVAIGYSAMASNCCGSDLTGSSNVAVGAFALQVITAGGGENAGVGAYALQRVTTGTNNAALGFGSATQITTGSNNLILGANVAATTLTTGSNNILIGTNTGVDAQSNSSSNTLNIGNLIYGTGLASSGTTPTGNVGIGTTNPSDLLMVGETNAGAGITIQNNSSSSAQYPTMSIKDFTGGNGGAPGLAFYTSRGTSAAPAAVQCCDGMGSISANGQYDSTAGHVVQGGFINFYAVGPFSSGSAPTEIAFGTTPYGYGAPSERMRINNAGLVGIGTTSPTAGVALDLGSNTTASNSSLLLPIGTTGTRPTTGVNGMLRYNSTTPTVEAYVNGTWTALTSGSSGSGSYTATGSPTPNLTGSYSAAGTYNGFTDYSSGSGYIWYLNTGGGFWIVSTSLGTQTNDFYAASSGSTPTVGSYTAQNGASGTLTLAAGGSGSGTVSAGTQYQIGYYAATGSTISGDSHITTDSSNDLLVPSGKVGIGTATPANSLDVAGPAVIGASFAGLGGPYQGLAVQGAISIGTTGATGPFDIHSNSFGGGPRTGYGQVMSLQGSTITDLTTAASGTPSAAFDVNVINQSLIAATNTNVTESRSSTMYLGGAPIAYTHAGITTDSALYIDDFTTTLATGGTAPTNTYGIYDNAQTGGTNNYAAAFMGGNVGIGTTAPANPLDVAGTADVSGAVLATLGLQNSGFGEFSSWLQNSYGQLYLTNNAKEVSTSWEYDTFGPAAQIQIGGGAINFNTTNGAYGYNGGIATWNTFMTIGSTGNIGIGTTTPTHNLSFNGNSAQEIWMERATSGAGNNMTIMAGSAQSGATDTNGGNLTIASGISTGGGYSSIYFNTYTGYPGHSTDNSPNTTMAINGHNGYVGVGSYDSINASAPLYATSGSDGVTIRIANPDYGALSFQSLNGSGNKTDFAMIQDGIQSGTAGSEQGYLTFQTIQTGTMKEAMRIDGSGNVGIGTASPSFPLTVMSTTTANYPTLVLATRATSEQADISYFSTGNEKWDSGMNTDNSYFIYDDVGGRTVFDVASNGNMSLMPSGGAVGIGTTSPATGAVLDLSNNTTTANSSMILPVGTTGTRPATGVPGMLRYNSTTPAVEAYVGSAWTALSGGGGGSGTVNTGALYNLAYYAAAGTTVSGDTAITTDASSDLIVTTGVVSIGTTSTTNAINLKGSAAQTISMVRMTTPAAGNNLTIQAGGGKATTSNLAGGNLILASGISTGTGASNVQFSVYPAGSTGTGDNTALTALTVTGTGLTGTTNATTLQANAGSGSNKNGGALTLASGVSTGTGTSQMQFQVYPAGVAGSTVNPATTAMTIASNGYVGIGTTNPGSLLTLQSSLNAYPWTLLNLVDTAATGYSELGYTSTDGHAWYEGIGNASETRYGVPDKWFVYDATASAVRMTIDTSGNVGIGTTSPSTMFDVNGNTVLGGLTVNNGGYYGHGLIDINSTDLGVAGTTSYGSLNFASNNANTYGTVGTRTRLMSMENRDYMDWILNGGGAGTWVIGTPTTYGIGDAFAVSTSSGYVGIGTIYPALPLDIEGSNGNAAIQVQNTSSSSAQYPGLLLNNYTGGNGGNAVVTFFASRGSAGSPAAIQASDVLGNIQAYGQYDTTAGHSGQGGFIYFAADANWSASSWPMDIMFTTVPASSTTAVERMRITASGKVGIGTSAPAGQLNVYAPAGVTPLYTVNNDTADFGYGIYSVVNRANTKAIAAANGSTDVFDVMGSGSVSIGTTGQVTLNPTSSSYFTGGFVGIGTNNPQTTLQVAGSIMMGTGTCATGTVGSIQYSGGAVQYCNGTSWANISSGGGSTTLNGITAATASQAGIDSLTNTIVWNWSTLTSGTALALSIGSTGANSNITFSATNATTGSGAAVKGIMSGANTGAAVFGTSAATSASGYGVEGALTSTSAAGAAVYGTNSNTAGGGYGVYSAGRFGVVPPVSTSGVATAVTVTGAANTGLTVATEVPDVYFNLARSVAWGGNGTVALQRAVRIDAPTLNGGTGTVMTNAATVGINGAPIWANNLSLTNTHALLIGSNNVSAATNSYGLTVNAQTGATNNYAAEFLGGNVGIGTTSPTNTLEVNGGVKIDSTNFLNFNTNGSISYANTGTFQGILIKNSSTEPINLETAGAAPIVFATNGAEAMRIVSGGSVGIGTTSPTTGVVLDLGHNTTTANSSVLLPLGTTGTRPTTGVNGMIRYNSTTPAVEAYVNGAWTSLGGGAGSGTVNSSTQYYMAYYAANGAAVSGDANIKTDASNDLIVPAGSLGVGVSTPGYPIDIETTTTGTSGSYTDGWFSNYVQPASSSSAIYYGGWYNTNIGSGSSSITGEAAGLTAQTSNGATGGAVTIRQTAGMKAISSNQNASTITTGIGIMGWTENTGAGTVTNAYGGDFFVNKSAGTITNGTGVYIGNVAGTNHWSLYASDATSPSYFAGNVGIGTTSPAQSLEVNGSIQIDGSNLTALKFYGGGLINNYISNSFGSLIIGNNTQNPLSFDQPYNAGGYIQIGGGTMGFYVAPVAASPAWVEAIAIGTTGNVGIGTTTHTDQLDVAGGIGITTASAAPSYGMNVVAGGYGLNINSSTLLSINQGGVNSIGMGYNGTGSIQMQVYSGSFMESLTGDQMQLYRSNVADATTDPILLVGSAAGTALPTGSETTAEYFNNSSTRTHATGAITLQRDFRISPTTHAFAGASTLTNAAELAIDGPPAAGTNATITNSSAIYVPTSALSTGVTNSYGLNITASTGATNNYAAALMGGNVGIGTTNPATQLSIYGGSYTNIGTVGGSTPYSGIQFGPSSTGVTSNGYSLLGNGTDTYIGRPSGGKIHFAEGGADQMLIVTGGNVGIGTNSPQTTLQVVGSIMMGTGTCSSSTPGSIQYSGGAIQFCNGTSWANISSGGGGSLTGATYQIPTFTATNTASGNANIVTDSGSDLILNGGTTSNLSIGTTTTTNLINLKGSAVGTVGMVRSTSGAGSSLTIQAGGGKSATSNLAGGNLVLASGISTGTGNSAIQFNVYPSGSTGTADNNAIAALFIGATGLTGSTASTQVTAATGTGSNQNGGNLILSSGVSTGTGTSQMQFNVFGAGVAGSTANGSTTAMTINSTGFVGIGTTSPNTALEVTGTIRSDQNGGGSTAGFQAVNTGGAGYAWNISSNGTDQKWWDAWANGTALNFRAVNDANSGATTWMQVNRGSGYTVSNVAFPNSNVGIGSSGASYPLDVLNAGTGPQILAQFNNSDLGSGTSESRIVFAEGSSYYQGISGKFNAALPYMGFSVSNTANTWAEKMRISYNGNVGIGTTSPSETLDVNGFVRFRPAAESNGGTSSYLWLDGGATVASGSLQNTAGVVALSDNAIWNGYWMTDPNGYYGPAAQIQMTGTSGSPAGAIEFNVAPTNYVGTAITWTNAMTITNGGSVGIGTTAPVGTLHVVGSTGGTATVTGDIILQNDSGSGNGTNFTMAGGNSGTANLNFGSRSSSPGRLRYDIFNNFMSFWTNTAEAMRITSNGYVGIGTTSPGYPLDVEGGTAAGAAINIASTATTYGPFLQIKSAGTGGHAWQITSDQASNVGGLGTLEFYDATAAATRMVISSTGSVGIGTSSPGAQLDVQAGTATTAVPILNLTQTWNAGGVTFTGVLENITNTASASGSLLMNLEVGGTSEFKVDKGGNAYATSLILSSDQTLKHDIKSLDTKRALDDISALRPVSFKWNNSGEADLGLIAQEVEPVYPSIVKPGVNDKLGVESVSLIAPIIASIQELKKQNEELQKQNAALRHDVEMLKAQSHKSSKGSSTP